MKEGQDIAAGQILDGKREVITSRQNPLVRLLCALNEKKAREKEGLFRFDGWKLAAEAIEYRVPLVAICLRASDAEKTAEKIGISKNSHLELVKILSDGVFEKISEEKSPDGVICLAKALDKFHKKITINKGCSSEASEEAASIEAQIARLPDRILYLSSVRDPGNVGTVLRTAAAFGVGEVLLSGDCADLYAPRTLRAAMGAVFRLPTTRIIGSDCDAVAFLRKSGRKVYTTALSRSALRLGTFRTEPRDCFLIGNEGHGLDASLIDASDGAVYIPMEPGSESLNAAVAAAVCLWEGYRMSGDCMYEDRMSGDRMSGYRTGDDRA